MSARMKTHPTKESCYIGVKVEMPDGKKELYHIPNSESKKLQSFLKELGMPQTQITPWEKAIPWEVLAKDRIEKYKKAGLILRGARYRENMSQTKLSQMSGVHQNEISKIENGKRGIGEKVAKKLAKPLKINYLLLLDEV